MKYKLIAVLLVGAIGITGCATRVGSLINEQNYADAYALTVVAPMWKKERASAVRELMEKTGGSKGDKFFLSLKSQLKYAPKHDKSTYLESIEVWENAFGDGLISDAQYKVLKDELVDLIEEAMISNPSVVDHDAVNNFMRTQNSNVSDRAIKNLKKLVGDQDYSAEKYLKIYRFFEKSNDVDNKAQAIASYRTAVQKTLDAESGLKDYESARSLLEYVKITQDRSLDEKFISRLAKIPLSRNNLEELMPIFPQFSRRQMESRLIKIDIKTNGDEFLAAEVGGALKNKNEWIDLDPDYPRKLNLIRFRINEQRGTPVAMTETVSDPDFSTLLFIPKNASVLFDYTLTEYALQWNLTAQDSVTKRSKNIAGSKKFKKVECRNIRYQNVFGGTGALSGYPNGRVQSFCTNNAYVDFDSERDKMIQEIAGAINDSLYFNP